MELFDHEHNTMKRERLDVKQEFNVSVAQGELNPRLTNTISRVTSLDSKYRKNGKSNIIIYQHVNADLIIEINNIIYSLLYLISFI